MRWGSGWGEYWGDPDTLVIILDVQDLGSGAQITFIKPTGYPEYCQLVIDGVNSGPPKWVVDGVITVLKGNYALNVGPHYISVVGVGYWATPDFFDVTPVQTAFLSGRANRIHMEMLSSPELFSVGDTAQFSNWSLTGVARFTNVRAVENRPTWGELDLTMTTSGGVHTVTAALNGTTIFSGSRTGNGSITLTDKTGGAITGTVTLAYTADITSGGFFVAAWPAQYNVFYRASGAWGAGDFPTVTNATWAASVATLTIGAHTLTVGTTVNVSGILPYGYNGQYIISAVTGTTISFPLATNPGAFVSSGKLSVFSAIVWDDGHSNYFSFESPVLGNGTFYCLVHQQNENGEESSGLVNSTQALVTVPAQPGLPLYASGGFANTVINYTASTDATSTYNIYDSADNGIIPPGVAATHIAGSGTLSSTLPAISNTFTGIRYVLVRSLLAGVESTNSIVLQITYANGVVTIVRPNAPQMRNVKTVGRTLILGWSLDTNATPVAATSVKLFLATTPTGFNYAAPVATVVPTGSGRVLFGTIAGDAAADGEYYFTVRTDSANGQSVNTNADGPIKLSLAVPGDPTFSVRGGI